MQLQLSLEFQVVRGRLEEKRRLPNACHALYAYEKLNRPIAVPSPIGLVLRPREREKVPKADEGRWEETSPVERVRVRVSPANDLTI